jgi:hypothetical protein
VEVASLRYSPVRVGLTLRTKWAPRPEFHACLINLIVFGLNGRNIPVKFDNMRQCQSSAAISVEDTAANALQTGCIAFTAATFACLSYDIDCFLRFVTHFRRIFLHKSMYFTGCDDGALCCTNARVIAGCAHGCLRRHRAQCESPETAASGARKR